jgi:glutamate-1-semialdehyde aminotransferase/spore coat polysaccharide biosynthesis protein SpsF (cytidylyltransferase family)
MGSMRFPNKVLRPVCGTPLIGLLLKRLSKALRIDLIVLATSEDARNDSLARYVDELGYAVFRGSENDVLDRYYRAAKIFDADVVVRVTGDCPLIDAAVVDEVIAEFLSSGVDYASNVSPPTFPNGLDTEVFSFAALETAWQQAKASRDREHVTPYIRESEQFTLHNVAIETDESIERWTVDEPADFEVVQKVFEHFQPRYDFGWREVLSLRQEHPEWFEANRHLVRNEGARLGTGQKLWRRAKRVIPGGNMVLSKRPEIHLPDYWPTYFSKAEGCRIWDLDGRQFIDMSIMGGGDNTLGYAHPEVDAAVSRAIVAGNVSTLNSPEEVFLAERLVEIHPWADMVQLAHCESEADAIAIRIARAASGRNKVAVCCDDDNWHEDHLTGDDAGKRSLASHLPPAFAPKGAPERLLGGFLPFRYNDFAQLQELVNQQNIGVIKMEVTRGGSSEEDFLQKVRALASKRGMVLIFDERASAFRENFGGLHKHYGIEPDVAIFGKAIGNGYAITAVIGKREVMQVAQSTFISNTQWSERIGPTAALKTLEVMERERSWESTCRTSRDIRMRWQALAKKYELPLRLRALPALISFGFELTDMLKYKTLITQQMLKSDLLATNSVYVCTAHTQPEVDQYISALDPLFALIKECELGRPIDALLEGPVCHVGQHLN